MLTLTYIFHGRRSRWLAVWLLWLLGSSGLAHGQATAPIMVRATPPGSVGLSVGQSQLLTATAVYPAFLSAGFDGPVWATAVQADGKILVGGSFTHFGTTDQRYLARLNADGTLDASFTAGTELNGPVYAIAQANGDILLGGDFTTFGSTSCLRLARLLPTGALDPTFVTTSATVGFNGPVQAIAVQSGGDIVVGGAFTTSGSNTTTASYLVRLSSAGVFDNAFATKTHGAGTSFDAAVLALVVQGSGSTGGMLVGGRFTLPGRGIMRLLSDGALDPSFTTTGGPTQGEIAAIAEFNGGILVGGNFSYTSGGIPVSSLNRLALLSSTGQPQPATTFTSPFPNAGANERVNSIAVLSSNSLLVGGRFSVGSSTSPTNLVNITAAGVPNSGFDVGAGFAGTTVTGTSPAVNSLALQPGVLGGNVVVGGNFTTYKGLAANCIARLKPTGKADDLDVPVPGTVAYAWTRNGTPVAGGSSNTLLTNLAGMYWATATTSGGVVNSSNTVTLTVAAPTLAPIAVHITPQRPVTVASSQLLTASAVYPALQVGTGFRDRVNPISPIPYVWNFKTQPNGKLVVGGNFTSYNGAPCRFIARLNADGSLDPAFTHATTASVGINDVVTVVALQPGGKIVLGGDFTGYGGSLGFARHLARLNTDGSLDNTFKGGLSNSPEAVTIQPDGKLLIGGNFPFYYHSSSPNTAISVPFIIRLTADGDLDPSFAAPSTGGLDSYVFDMALQPDGKVLVGGHFANYGTTPRERVVRLNVDGSLDPSFDPAGAGLGISSTSRPSDVYTLALQPDGKVLVGGEFAQALIRLNPDGSRDLSFTPPALTAVNAATAISVSTLVLQSDGRVLVGGNFKGHVVRLNPNGSPDATFTLNGSSTTLGFNDNVHTLAIQPDKQVLVGGPFTSYSSASATASRSGLARLNEDGTLNDTDTTLPGTATYAWNNGSTSDTLWVAASGRYSVTASFLGQTAISNTVDITVGGAAPPPFSVNITPTGPLSLCAGSGNQQLTAQAVGVAPGAATYAWWWVPRKGTPSYLGVGTSAPTTSSQPVLSAGRYYVLATVGSGPLAGTAMSAAVSVGVAPLPALTNSVTAMPNTNVVLTGTNLAQVTEVRFGTVPAVFALSAAAPGVAATLTVTVPATLTTSSDISVFTACSTTPITRAGGFSLPTPTISPTVPLVGAPGTTVAVTGTGFIVGATTVTLGTLSVTVAVTSGTQLTLTIPPNAAIGPGALVVTTAGGSSNVGTLMVTAAATPVVISASTTLPADNTYANNNLIIKAPAVVTIAGSSAPGNAFTVSRLEVQDGATLNLPANTVVTGPAGSTSSFLLAAGATLTVGHPNGLGSAAAPGAIQLTNLFFSPDASYGYSGTQPQATGSNLPTQVRNLTSTNSSSLTLSRPVSIAQVLKIDGTGHFFLNNQALTILSSATGTALVVNAGAGRVLGTATVQRYINPAANPGVGFRYYGSPVKGATAAVLAAPAFDYDQSRYRPTVQQDTLPLISYGFTTSSLAPNTPLEVGRGYRAAVSAATTVQFTGTLTTGDTTITLTRKGNNAYNGWHLVSNPYPAPLNWTKLIRDGRLTGLDEAIYLYESTNTSAGSYRCYVNGVRNEGGTKSDLLIAMGQAFFVRVRKGQPTGTLAFRDDCRETSYLQQASFNRPAAAAPFLIQASLEKNGSGGGSGSCSQCSAQASRIAVYTDADGASVFNAPFKPKLDADASNLFSFRQQTLSIYGNSPDSTLAIRAITMPLAKQLRVIPLLLTATRSGAYTLRFDIEQLSSLTTNGLRPYLLDTALPVTSQLIDLTAAGTSTYSYSFSLDDLTILSGVSNRFSLVLQEPITTATLAGTGLGSAVVFPNPTRQQIHVWVPAPGGASQVQATLLTTMGQVVRQQTAPLPAAGATLDIAAHDLASGVYILRLQAGGSTTIRRVVLEP